MKANWLAPGDREWVAQNRPLLEAIWERFDMDGAWPDPVELQRALRAAVPSSRPDQALAKLPPSLAYQEWAHPPHVALTLFGLGCCPGARSLLENYRGLIRIALRRFDSPELPNRLCREEAIAELGLSKHDADRLSRVLMRDAPFLGGGGAEVDSWDLQIDPGVLRYEECGSVDELLSVLSEERPTPSGLASVLAAGARIESSESEEFPVADGKADQQPLSALVPAVAAAFTFLIGLFVLSLPMAIGLAIAFIGVILLLWRRRLTLFSAFLLLLCAGLGVAAGLHFSSDPNSNHRYFVADADEGAVLIPRIEPRAGGTMADGVLGIGDQVMVSCTLKAADSNWAKLTDGTFVELAYLQPEVGGGRAPVC